MRQEEEKGGKVHPKNTDGLDLKGNIYCLACRYNVTSPSSLKFNVIDLILCDL